MNDHWETWNEDRWLHELLWIAESAIRSLKEHDAMIPMGAVSYIDNLDNATSKLRQWWSMNDKRVPDEPVQSK